MTSRRHDPPAAGGFALAVVVEAAVGADAAFAAEVGLPVAAGVTPAELPAEVALGSAGEADSKRAK